MSRFPKIASSRLLASFRTAGAIAAVTVLTTMSSAWATDSPQVATPAPQQTASPNRDAPTGTHIVSKPADLAPIVVFAGAVHGSGDAQWSDNDTAVAELPMVRE